MELPVAIAESDYTAEVVEKAAPVLREEPKA